MKTEFEKKYHDLEKDHFWFKARRNYILQLLKKIPKDVKILDIGCSSGVLINDLLNIGFKAENLYGIDISPKAIHLCKKNGIQNSFVMDAQKISLSEKFDIILVSDCLEHLEKDQKVLDNWCDLMKPNGMAYIFVPAFMSLWSEHDEVNMHFRRYTKRELNTKLIKSDFEVIKSSYWNFFLFLPIFLFRFIGRLKENNKHKNTGNLEKIPLFNGLLFKLLKFENKLLDYFNFPFGLSVYCIAKKTSLKKINGIKTTVY